MYGLVAKMRLALLIVLFLCYACDHSSLDPGLDAGNVHPTNAAGEATTSPVTNDFNFTGICTATSDRSSPLIGVYKFVDGYRVDKNGTEWRYDSDDNLIQVHWKSIEEYGCTCETTMQNGTDCWGCETREVVHDLNVEIVRNEINQVIGCELTGDQGNRNIQPNAPRVICDVSYDEGGRILNEYSHEPGFLYRYDDKNQIVERKYLGTHPYAREGWCDYATDDMPLTYMVTYNSENAELVTATTTDHCPDIPNIDSIVTFSNCPLGVIPQIFDIPR